MTIQQHIAAPAGEVFWRYGVPPRTDAKVLLLTVGRTAVIGNWTGGYGDAFIAWAPLPKRDKTEEARLGLAPKRPKEP